jgi:hypothetical protein
VVAPAAGHVLHPRRPPVLAHHDDRGVVQHPAGVQVVEQRGERGVEARPELVLQPRGLVDVRVPPGVHQPVLVPAHGDELPTGFQQPPGGQARLTEQRHPVAGAEFFGFALHVERVAELARREHRPGQRPVPVERNRLAPRFARAAGGVELIQKGRAVVESVEGDRFVRLHRLEPVGREDAEVRVGDHRLGLLRVAAVAQHLAGALRPELGPHGVVGRPQEPAERARARRPALRPELERQPVVPRHRRRLRALLRPEVIDHRPDERPVPRVAHVPLERQVGGGHPAEGERGAVDRGVVRQRPQDGNAVELLRQLREHLADAHPGQHGLNRPEFAADLGRGVWLGVERVDLARRPPQVQQDAPLGRAEPVRRGRVRARRLRGPRPPFERQPGGRERPDVEQISAGEAVAEQLLRAEDAKHVRLRSGRAGGGERAGGEVEPTTKCVPKATAESVDVRSPVDVPRRTLFGATTVRSQVVIP